MSVVCRGRLSEQASRKYEFCNWGDVGVGGDDEEENTYKKS